MAGSIHLFKITGTLTSENIKLKKKQNLEYNRNRLEGSPCDSKQK